MNKKDLTMDSASKKILNVLDSGKASEKFEQMVAELGGPKNILSNYKKILPASKYTEDIFSDVSGYIEFISTRELGMILIELGGGRKKVTDKIDYSVGYSNVVNVGDKVDTKTPLLTIHAKNNEDIKSIKTRIKNCFILSDKIINPLKDVYGKVS